MVNFKELIQDNEIVDISYKTKKNPEIVHPRVIYRDGIPYVYCKKNHIPLTTFLERFAKGEDGMWLAGYRKSNGRQTTITFNNVGQLSFGSLFKNVVAQIKKTGLASLDKPIIETANVNIPAKPTKSSTEEAINNVQFDNNGAAFESEISSIEAQQKKLGEFLSPTEIDAWVKRRVGQGPFRSELLEIFQSKCAISELTDPSLLIASHIRPWSKCDQGQHRDPNNGILLSVTWDALFDKFLISFEDDGTMVTSELVDDITLEKLGISEKPNLPGKYLTPSRRVFLKYHRENILKKTG